MALILDGNGTVDTGTMVFGNGDITGLAAGALPSNVIGAGAVLQAVTGTYGSSVVITSTSFVDVNLSASITPSSTSSKVLVLVYPGVAYVHNVDSEAISFQVLRGATKVTGATNHLFISSAVYRRAGLMLSVLDSPNTTSATTYKLQALSRLGNEVQVNVNNDPISITLMEIAG